MKTKFHERNKHQGLYDFKKLVKTSPTLSEYIIENKNSEPSIDFSSRRSLYELNKALILDQYGLEYWDINDNHLVPGIPSRAEYILHAADLFLPYTKKRIPRGKFTMMDIGVGAGLVYPIIATQTYGWKCIATDIDEESLAQATKIMKLNQSLKGNISFRLQPKKDHVFTGIVDQSEYIDLVVCNPPFFISKKEAEKANQRKWKNLKTKGLSNFNFGGTANEIWTPGGEKAFVKTMIQESALISKQCFYFTSLVSNKDHIKDLEMEAKRNKVVSFEVVEMQYGQKMSRFIAWSFLDDKQRDAWVKYRFLA